MCISNKFPLDADAAGPEPPHFENNCLKLSVYPGTLSKFVVPWGKKFID